MGLKAYLHFSLPEEEGQFRVASRAMDWALSVWDMSGWLRVRLKYGHSFKTADEALEACRRELFEYLDNRGVSLDDIE